MSVTALARLVVFAATSSVAFRESMPMRARPGSRVAVASARYEAQLQRARRERDAPPPTLTPEAVSAFDARIRKNGAAPEVEAEAAPPAAAGGSDAATASARATLAARASRRGALAEAEARRLDASLQEVIEQLRARGADG